MIGAAALKPKAVVYLLDVCAFTSLFGFGRNCSSFAASWVCQQYFCNSEAYHCTAAAGSQAGSAHIGILWLSGILEWSVHSECFHLNLFRSNGYSALAFNNNSCNFDAADLCRYTRYTVYTVKKSALFFCAMSAGEVIVGWPGAWVLLTLNTA